MKLQNMKAHMRGKAVRVDGALYQIDAEGVADIPDEDHAKKLLAGPNWIPWKPPKDEPQKAPQEALKPSPKPVPPKEPAKVPEAAEKAAETGSEASDGEETESNEWPDPATGMKKDYLQEMAKAYEVEGWEGMTKQQLVDGIMGKMYE